MPLGRKFTSLRQQLTESVQAEKETSLNVSGGPKVLLAALLCDNRSREWRIVCRDSVRDEHCMRIPWHRYPLEGNGMTGTVNKLSLSAHDLLRVSEL